MLEKGAIASTAPKSIAAIAYNVEVLENKLESNL
jgi:hypothetical protein